MMNGESYFSMAEVSVLDVSTSDYLPLLIQLNKMIYMPYKRRFYFENLWI